jgi:carbamoyltransferase
MIVLGLGGAVGHDPAAALVADGKVVAAADEERFNRNKHSKGLQPELATQFCLKQAGVKPQDVQVVAYPFAPISLFGPARWHFAKRHWYAPDRALVALCNGNRRYRRNVRNVFDMLEKVGINPRQIQFVPVEHHLAHASSAYHLSGYKEAAITSIDGVGICTTWFGSGRGGGIHRLKEFFSPDSLGGFYGAITEYLGFEMLDGEFKVMGMAPYGNATKFNLDPLIRWNERGFTINTRLVNCIGWRRYKKDGKGTYFSAKLVKMWGPARQGDEIDEPYVHIAASVQKLLEEIVLALMKHYLGEEIARTKRLCYAGGVALNVKCNQRIIQTLGADTSCSFNPRRVTPARLLALQPGRRISSGTRSNRCRIRILVRSIRTRKSRRY